MSYRLANVKVWDGTQWVTAVGYGEANIVNVLDEAVLIDLLVVTEGTTISSVTDDQKDYTDNITISDIDLTITDTITVSLV